MCSAASSGISQPNSSSKAMTSSTVSKLSAPRSSMKLAFSVTLSASTEMLHNDLLHALCDIAHRLPSRPWLELLTWPAGGPVSECWTAFCLAGPLKLRRTGRKGGYRSPTRDGGRVPGSQAFPQIPRAKTVGSLTHFPSVGQRGAVARGKVVEPRPASVSRLAGGLSLTMASNIAMPPLMCSVGH